MTRLRKELHQCVARCVQNYQTCRLHAERNDSFLELQASLADDVPGRVGFDGACPAHADAGSVGAAYVCLCVSSV